MTNLPGSISIQKSIGQTPTERYLAELCDRTFLKLWNYPNPFKADGKELCDLLVVFENHVFLFFDRESRKLDAADKDIFITWDRWKREVIDKQIRTAGGAKNYIERNRDAIFLDPKATIPFPLKIPEGDVRIHRVVVAHGAKEACLRFSDRNASGSLAICYGSADENVPWPFLVSLDKEDPVHILDSHTLEIVLAELDTLHDFAAYLDAKEKAIAELKFLAYCGEEDLLGHYFQHFSETTRTHYINSNEKNAKYDALFLAEGRWSSFVNSPPYRRRKEENKNSYFWDHLIQKTSANALKGTLEGNGNVFHGQSAIHEMAKEPRLSRRALSELIKEAVVNFPEYNGEFVRHLKFLQSYHKGRAYVFLQIWHPNDKDYRPMRRHMLEVACGAAKNKFLELTQLIGIAMDAPKYARLNSEDFMLMNCANWTEEQRGYYEEANRLLQFFETKSLKLGRSSVQDFPTGGHRLQLNAKIGRNEVCPCGSGRKYKHCHGASNR